MLTALGCHTDQGILVFAGLGTCGAAQAIVLLSRAAAAEMFPPERRARGMSIVLFAVVSGAVWGPLVFGPMFANRELTPEDLVVPWLAAGCFTIVGLALSFGVRPDPKELSKVYPDAPSDEGGVEPAAPVREILRRPGVAPAMLGAVASFAVMVGVMNLSGYVAVGHGHDHGDIFTIISLHIVGMYGLVLVVGDLVDRIGRRESIVIGLSTMALSNLALVWLDGIAGMSLALFGLGLGWCLSYVAATTELVGLAAPSERGRLIGLTDLASSGCGAALALGGGVLYTAGGSVPLALAAVALAALPALVAAVPARVPPAAQLAD
jgi:MFS family permease